MILPTIPQRLQSTIVIIIIVLLLIIFRGWLRDKIITTLGGYTDKETEVVIETEYIKGKIDTLAVFNKYVKTKGIILNPKPEIIIKEVPTGNEEYKKFEADISDSLITGTVTVFNGFDGILKEVELNYKPKFPKYITRVDTIRTTNTVTNTLSTERDMLGIGAGYNNMNQASILASYTTKKGWQFIGEYGRNLEQTYMPKNTDLISLKIIKNF